MNQEEKMNAAIKKREEAKVNWIKSFIEKVQIVFPQTSFRCEYYLLRNTYITEVKPLAIFKESYQYAELEYNFIREFEKIFPEYTLLFVSDGDIIKVENPLFVVGPKKVVSQPERKRSVVPAPEYEPCYA
jgi:hypothetical protein